ncbi:RING finger protein 17 [Megalops cyprinoides]|uniref:RING finger protein 17 n=1 Tax=Megalops cyprinoides TaxID=118141 RepID=UPI0018648CA5|nr:RING finger protein 17 [Megalops cyprinoides]
MSERSDSLNALVCDICGLAYTLPEDGVAGNLPHMLLCGHIFCTTCLRSLECKKVIVCPDCKVGSTLSEDGVEGLQVDSRIVGLIYTAKMNMRKNRGGERPRNRRPKSPDPPLKESTEPDSHPENALTNALCQAEENLSQLESIHQTLVKGLAVQAKKERSRLLKEIDDAVDRASGMLHRRKGALVAELTHMEQLFPSSRLELNRVEERRKALQTAIQKARQVQHCPSLGEYCNLEELVEMLQSPVDVQSYDLGCLSLGSGLSVSVHGDGLTQSLKASIQITVGSPKVLTGDEPVATGPPQPGPERKVWRSSLSPQDKRSSRHSPGATEPSPPRREQASQRIGPAQASSPWPSPDSPNVLIEEIVQEGEPVKAASGRQMKKSRKSALNIPPGGQGKVFQEWVFVTHVVNPNHFYIRHVAENRAGALLSKKINGLCSGERGLFAPGDVVETGSMMFMRWKEGMWSRVLVREVFQRGRDEPVPCSPVSELARLQVFFQDYGFTRVISLTDGGASAADSLNECVRRVDLAVQAEMNRWPPQAVRCSLKDIVPADLEAGWSSEAQAEFQRVVGCKAVEMQVFGVERDSLLVDLKKAPMDKSVSDMPLSLRDYLVFLELAMFYSPIAKPSPSSRRPLHFYPPAYPRLMVELDAVVCHVNSPSDFYIQLVDSMEFLLLNAKLQECYSADGLEVFCPTLEQACVALFEDKGWYRAQVIGLPGNRMVEVRYVDFGNKKTLSVKDIRKLKDEFLVLPAMAIQCCLADLEPPGNAESWSEECKERFRNLAEQKLMSTMATERVPWHQPMPVRLLEVNSSNDQSTDIAELLVKEELASFRKGMKPQAPTVETDIWDPPFEGLVEGGGPELDLPSEDGDTLDLQPNLQLPKNLKDLRVRVTHVASPGSFFVQLLQMDNHLKKVYEMLKDEYARSEPLPVDWKAEMHCAVYVSGVWERGQVCSVSSSSIAEVVRCDFGNKVKLHISNLRPLRPDLIGCLALECSLSDIRPAGGLTTWTATACDFISYYMRGAMAIMTIKENTAERPVPVALYCSNMAGQDVSIADFLVSEGLALKERKPKGPLPAPRCAAPPEAVQTRPYAPPELPHCGLRQMTVTAVGDDGVIYAMTRHAEHQFEKLKDRLQQHIRSLPRQKPCSWKNVLGCAVMGSDMLWYRGEVLELIGGHVKVRYVDQGLVENIPACHVYPTVLCEDVPQLCIPCRLHGVIPVGGEWQWDAVALLRELLHNRSVNLQIMELPSDPLGNMTVQVLLDGMTLSRIMVHHQHATFDPAASAQEEYVVTSSVTELDDWELNIKGLEDPGPVLGVYTYPRLPDKGEHFPVQIKHLRTPNEVFLCPLTEDGDESEDGESLEEALKQVNADVDRLPLLTDFPIEGPCLAEYSDGKYYRAKLLGFEGFNPVRFLVRHVDFGSDDTLSMQRLRQIPLQLLGFPCQAIKVRVAGFKPPRLNLEKERVSYRPEWSMKAALEMIDLLHGCVTASVMSTEPEKVVFLYDEKGVLVHLPLVEKGLADLE